nr:putative ankyrin repeat protein RF_0381 [Tanacetum cinerariifolium]
GLADVVKNLIKKGIDIEAMDEKGYTALHCGVESRSIEVVELLVKKGADVEARTKKGADLEVDWVRVRVKNMGVLIGLTAECE